MNVALKLLNKIIDISGYICVAALLLMICNVFIDVFIRYVVFGLLQYFQWVAAIDWFNEYLGWLGGVGMQEMEWHFFSIMFLLGLGYTLRENSHVRVDVFYDRFSRKTQALINIGGAIIFTIPFCLVVVLGDGLVGEGFDFGDGEAAWGFFLNSWNSEENMGDPGSLARLWPVKFVLPLAFTFLFLSCIAVIIKELSVLKEELGGQQ